MARHPNMELLYQIEMHNNLMKYIILGSGGKLCKMSMRVGATVEYGPNYDFDQ